ncbi:MAG: excinuclease ABC subunit UvrC [Lutispora sp.]|nr:excinuclease ABC subunit UvrC [Lutispora sp.]MDD4834039.1 excinuclease ABC subunit UvrC [Lutispora sp.]
MLNLEEKLKNLPDKPGVYIMKNEDNHIIYVGKAINLKNRVRQYFQASRNQHPKVTAMVENIRDFEYIITDSELEALILECNLIKKHRPRYNVMLKDDKHYPYIKVTLNESFPRVLKVREIKKDKAKYFGPYTDGKAVNQTIELISKIFPIRSCSKNIEKIAGKERPCLNAHINRCIAPCSGKVSKEEYGEIVKSILLFLEGKQHDLVLGLQEKMEKYAEALDFEKAAELRDQIDSVKKIGEKQIIISSNLEDQDIIAYAESGEIVCIQAFFVRAGKLIGRETFFLSDLGNSDGSEIISSFLKQFYNKAIYIPKTILVSDEFDEKSIIEEWLGKKRGTKVNIIAPQRGDRRKLIQMARSNAEENLRLEMEKSEKSKKTSEACMELGHYLNIEENIYRIEAFDISNIQGVDNVASMVVFEGGKPAKKNYRRFKIKGFEGQDDFGSMREIIGRRFIHGIEERKKIDEENEDYSHGKFSQFPDVIMVDGGLGHVNAAAGVLKELNLSIPICGMVKDDRHRTRGLIFDDKEIAIPQRSEAFKLIAFMQDEAHRFAIEYHRSLRQKKVAKSILDEIEGIGPGRKKALFKHFKGIDEIKKANLEELTAVKGMNKKVAENIYNFFNK